MRTKENKKKDGITIVALVTTIIVMLILVLVWGYTQTFINNVTLTSNAFYEGVERL